MTHNQEDQQEAQERLREILDPHETLFLEAKPPRLDVFKIHDNEPSRISWLIALALGLPMAGTGLRVRDPASFTDSLNKTLGHGYALKQRWL